MKEQLEKQLERFKQLYNLGGKETPIEIKLFSGARYSGHDIPLIYIGRDSSPKSLERHQKMYQSSSWYVEIIINGDLVWRESASIPNDKEVDASIIEKELIERLMFQIFCYGVSSSWRDTVDRRNKLATL